MQKWCERILRDLNIFLLLTSLHFEILIPSIREGDREIYFFIFHLVPGIPVLTISIK